MILTREKQIRATRLCLAMLISFIYTSYIGVSEGIWVVMTCPIILFDNATLGGTINKSHLRFWGTFFSAAFGLIFIVCFANNIIINLIAICIGIFLATYWYMDTKQSYAGGLISWTLPILLLNNNDLKSATLRLLNISIGIIISYILLRFFYPEYARNRMLNSIKNTLQEITDILQAITNQSYSRAEIQTIYQNHEERILTNINGFFRWKNEAAFETRKSPEYVVSADKAYLYIRRLYRILSVIVFHLEYDEIHQNEYLVMRYQHITNELGEITNVLATNQKSFFIPDKWQEVIVNRADIELLYTEYNSLSMREISNIIEEEINIAIGQLAIFLKCRKDNNYY